MSEWAAVIMAGLLGMIAYVLASIDGRLRKIADELMRTRQDNAAWRENVWDRDANRR